MNLADISRIDKDGMYDLVKGFPNQWKEGRQIAEAVDLNVDLSTKNQVVVVGMGGSAIAGDLVRCFAIDQSPVPISVVRNYELPASVDEHSVVIASSFSGNTEETLSAFQQALDRKATIICISSGGRVSELAAEHNLPIVKIPGGMPPRAALGYSLSVLMVVSSKLGLVQLSDTDWAESEALLDEQTATYSNPEGSHQAIEVAQALSQRFPFVYSSTGMMETVNLRWRGQFQENAKKLAVGNVYPELNHNEIMAWEFANGKTMHGNLGVVVLRDEADHSRVQHRMDVTRKLLSEKAGYWVEINSRGSSKLARMMSMINLGDWVSLYLAYLRDVDPTPIGLIDKLKSELAKV
ncbi:MAG: bifunctional phosphoglucose/phosphomannose isomerase [Rhodothermales bacterium]